MSTLLLGKACKWERRVLIGAILLGTLLQNYMLVVIASFILLFLCFFYRVPFFKVESLRKTVLQSPSTGKIIGIQKTKKGTIIFIFLNLLDPHVQFVPLAGFVRKVDRIAGPNEFAGTLQKKKNRVVTTIETLKGETITITQNTGVIARRIVNFLEPGDWVEKGDQLGMIKFGSRVDLLIPFSFQLKIVLGQRVHTGDILAVQK